MGLSLMKLELFQQSILRSDKALKDTGLKVSDMLLHADENTFEDAVHAFVGLAAIQVRVKAEALSQFCSKCVCLTTNTAFVIQLLILLIVLCKLLRSTPDVQARFECPLALLGNVYMCCAYSLRAEHTVQLWAVPPPPPRSRSSSNSSSGLWEWEDSGRDLKKKKIRVEALGSFHFLHLGPELCLEVRGREQQ